MEKSTDDLRMELMQTGDLKRFLQENQAVFRGEDVPGLLTELLKKENLSKSELARRSGVSEPYLHQIFSGKRTPSRDRLLCLCLGLGCSPEDTQNLLKHCGYAALYPGNRRDAIILFGILHSRSAFEVNDRLFAENEKTMM